MMAVVEMKLTIIRTEKINVCQNITYSKSKKGCPRLKLFLSQVKSESFQYQLVSEAKEMKIDFNVWTGINDIWKLYSRLGLSINLASFIAFATRVMPHLVHTVCSLAMIEVSIVTSWCTGL